MYFFNITKQRLEWALIGGIALIDATESGVVTYLNFSNMKELEASIDTVQWKL